MALAIPVVTLITAATADATGYMAALRTHFTSTSTKFNVKANGPTDDGFTLTPVSGVENWELNFRRSSATAIQTLIDPLEGITSPGDTGSAPTLTDSSEYSEEEPCLQYSASYSARFYVIELDDALFVLNMDAAETHTPVGCHLGRVYIPYFSDGLNGDNYADGLGMFGHIPRVSPSGIANLWLSTTANSCIRMAQTGSGRTAPTAAWYVAAPTFNPNSSKSGSVQGVFRPRPVVIDAVNTYSSNECNAGYCRYLLYGNGGVSTSQPPGTLMDAGPSKDSWCFIGYNTSNTFLVVPWDRTQSPVF
jgi:hypothetical protein